MLEALYFNPLSLYRERHFLCCISCCMVSFQSTLPIQGETLPDSCPVRNEYISIHSPYTGRDGTARSIHPCKPAFQSTLPIQGETRCIRDQFLCDGISIHSPYTGRDEPKEHTTSMWWYFNPLSLYRERLYPV